MNSVMSRYIKKSTQVLAVLTVSLLLTVSMAQAGATFVTDLGEWESMVSDIEVLTTTADNVFLANEVDSMPVPNSKWGPILTFEAINTGMSRSFSVESLQAAGQSEPTDPLFEGGFTFDDYDGGFPVTNSADALSVGDTDDFENDDWQLRILDGATVTAIAVEIRHSKYAPGETITLSLLSENQTVAVLDIGTAGTLPGDPTEDTTYFIGIVSDVPFDTVNFNEDEAGDDIAIADFRFANVANVTIGTEYSSTLGNNHRRCFRDVDIFKFTGTEGEEVVVNLDKDPSGKHKGDNATLILMDKMRGVRFFEYDRGALANEITAVLPVTGEYRIMIIEHRKFVKHWKHRGSKGFKGDYILRMDSSEGASDTLEATRWVE